MKCGEILSASALVALMTFPVSKVVSAADANGNFSVRGVGGTTCGAFVQALEAEDANTRRDAVLIYESWLNGYLTHINRSTELTYDASPIINARDMLVLVLRQCEAQPAALFETISSVVVSALFDMRTKARSDEVVLSDGSQQRNYRLATILLAQRALVDAGYLQGTPDGVFGPVSSTALAEFQRVSGLQATGFLDMDSLILLLAEK